MVSPTIRSPRVGMAPSYAAQARGTRRPQHRFNVKFQPWQLQPVMIAPVLPGETLRQLMLQSQCWSTPLKAGPLKNIGWWQEYFFFYVSHRDLSGYEGAADGLGKDLIDMFVSNESIASHQDADGNAVTYCPPGGVDFLLDATKRIAEEFFRDEGEAWDKATINGLPAVKIFGKGASDALEKMTLETEYEDRRVQVPDYMNEMQDAYVEWAAMRDAGLMDMDYEDWMRTYGTKSVLPNQDRVEHHRPEDLCHFREFVYPTNTVEPTTGLPSTAVGWRTAVRANKGFFFREPGWIVGYSTVRPKVYMQGQKGNIASMMQTRESWLPAIMHDQSDASHLLIAGNTGPMKDLFSDGVGGYHDYWLDLRDLLNYGDQFVNYAPSDAAPFLGLPTSANVRRYAQAGDGAAFFEAIAGVTSNFEADGLVSLSILGRQQERTKNLVLGQS